MIRVIAIFFLILLSSAGAEDIGNVGMVKRFKVTLPGELLVAVKVDEKAPAMVRIISWNKGSEGYSYDLEFIGLEPGKYNLMDYLRKASTLEAVDLPEYSLEVDTVLSEDFKGELLDFQNSVETLTPWYKRLNTVLIILWGILLPVIILVGRKKKKIEEVEIVKEKTLSEKIYELLDSLEDKSSKELWQKVEGLILKHWRYRKGLEGLPAHEAIIKLKADGEAGPFIVKLEQGLHSKNLKNEQQVAALIRKISQENPL